MALKNSILEFLGALEGYHETCKMLHWSTTNKSEHLLLFMSFFDISFFTLKSPTTIVL